jgi:hypothetical protein
MLMARGACRKEGAMERNPEPRITPDGELDARTEAKTDRRIERERALVEALEETFPASDAASLTQPAKSRYERRHEKSR